MLLFDLFLIYDSSFNVLYCNKCYTIPKSLMASSYMQLKLLLKTFFAIIVDDNRYIIVSNVKKTWSTNTFTLLVAYMGLLVRVLRGVWKKMNGVS